MMKLTITSLDITDMRKREIADLVAKDSFVDEDYGPDMSQFVCTVCDGRFFDVNLYFRDVPSTKCMWCAKYGKVKPVVKKATEIVAEITTPENG